MSDEPKKDVHAGEFHFGGKLLGDMGGRRLKAADELNKEWLGPPQIDAQIWTDGRTGERLVPMSSFKPLSNVTMEVVREPVNNRDLEPIVNKAVKTAMAHHLLAMNGVEEGGALPFLCAVFEFERLARALDEMDSNRSADPTLLAFPLSRRVALLTALDGHLQIMRQAVTTHLNLAVERLAMADQLREGAVTVEGIVEWLGSLTNEDLEKEKAEKAWAKKRHEEARATRNDDAQELKAAQLAREQHPDHTVFYPALLLDEPTDAFLQQWLELGGPEGTDKGAVFWVQLGSGQRVRVQVTKEEGR